MNISRNNEKSNAISGHDTTASAISWCLYHLAKHPDIQQKVFSEVNTIVGSRSSSSITWSVDVDIAKIIIIVSYRSYT